MTSKFYIAQFLAKKSPILRETTTKFRIQQKKR